jgi:hypothetical protein
LPPGFAVSGLRHGRWDGFPSARPAAVSRLRTGNGVSARFPARLRWQIFTGLNWRLMMRNGCLTFAPTIAVMRLIPFSGGVQRTALRDFVHVTPDLAATAESW